MIDPTPVHVRVQRALLALLAPLVLSALACAQYLRTQTYTELEGLPSTEVGDLALAPDGRMAFATRVGVGLFDGIDWEYHTQAEGFPLLYGCSRLEYDARGRLWVSGDHMIDGLAILEDGRWRRVKPSDGQNSGEWVRDLAVVSVGDESIVALVSRSGVVRLFSDAGWHWLLDERGARIDDVTSVVAHGESLLVVSGSGLRGFDFGATRLSEWLSVKLPPGRIRAAHFAHPTDAQQRLWVLANSWLGFVEGGRFELVAGGLAGLAEVPDSSFVLHEDGSGGAYFGDWATLRHYSARTGTLRRLGASEGLVSEGASGFELDREGGLWISSLRGVTRVPRQIFESYDARQGLFEDEVTAILESESGELILGHARGLSFFDGVSPPRVLPFSTPEKWARHHVRALDMQHGRSGDLWLAVSEIGVLHLRAGGEFESVEMPAESQVNSVLEDREGRLWVATSLGLYRQGRPGGALAQVERLRQRAVRRLYSGPSGDVYAGTAGWGLYRWRWTAGGRASEPEVFFHERDEFANSSYSILELRDGRVLVGTRSGLFQLRAGGLERPPEELGRDVPVYSLLEDSSGRLWAGTSRGVECWVDGERRHYSVSDGLAGQETNRAAALEDSRGAIWFGTDRGLSRFREGADRFPEPLVVASISERADGAELAETRLPAHSDIEFDYRLVHFDRDRAQLRSRLLGYESEWSASFPVGTRDLRYTNLPAGDYRLELQARRPGGAWGAKVSSRTITIESPIYLRAWFLILALALATVLASGVYALVSSRRRASTLEALAEQRGAALVKSERRYREMFTRTSAIQLVLDPDTWGVLDANPAACRFFEADLAHIVGRSLSELTGVSTDELEARAAALEETGGELVLRSPGESSEQHTALELRMCQYELRGRRVIQATVNDVTTRLRLEQELREAQKLRAVGELASGIAHDFNNLLAAILGFSELVSYEVPDNPAVRRHLEGINEAGERAAELVRQLLAFGRRQHLQLEELELSGIVTTFADLLRRLIDRRIEVALDLDPCPARIRADRGSIDRILMNLALNARDAMPDGGCLTIRTRCEVPLDGEPSDVPRRFVSLVVEDTGVGMDEVARSRMFEPFYTTKEVGKGTGLGLSSVHGIVGQSGGHIRVRSAPGRGTRVEMLFPVLAAEAETPHGAGAPAPALPVLRDAHDELGVLRVLLVDDEPGVRLSVGALLGSLGHVVIEAEDSAAALARIEEDAQNLDLLLTDVVMPGLSGPELVARAREVAPALRVLFMSGYQEELEGSEDEVLLAKPLNASQLSTALLAALRGPATGALHVDAAPGEAGS